MASPAVIVANWFAFLALTASFIGLLVFSLKYKGPTGKESYYNGFREQNMLGVFINLFCAVAYFAKIIAAHTDDVGFQPFTTIKYVDYLTTCPLLTIDMLWQLEAPYKVSSAALVLVCLTFAVAADGTPAPANYVWFGVGMAFFMFSYTFILGIVRGRLDFFISCARDSHAKKSIGYLKLALFSYFGIWLFFPVLWILGEKGVNIVSPDVSHVFHCILDVIAKSCYGYALLYFKVFFDKKLIASGVDEEEFSKFSKDVTTHKDDDDDDGPKRRKKKQIEHLPSLRGSSESRGGGSVAGDSYGPNEDLESPLAAPGFIAGARRGSQLSATPGSDNYTVFGRIALANDQPKPRRKKDDDDGFNELASKMRGASAGGSRSGSNRNSLQHPGTSFSSRTGRKGPSSAPGSERHDRGAFANSYLKQQAVGGDLEQGVPPLPFEGSQTGSSDDEYVERANSQYPGQRSRSVGRD